VNFGLGALITDYGPESRWPISAPGAWYANFGPGVTKRISAGSTHQILGRSLSEFGRDLEANFGPRVFRRISARGSLGEFRPGGL
jgi:hypothetical protein